MNFFFTEKELSLLLKNSHINSLISSEQVD